MSFSARYLPAVLLTILSLPTSLWAQATPKQTTKAPRGSISGRITIKEKGAEGVVVTLRKSDYQNPYEQTQRATTDQDGFYRIANVAAGSYELTPSAPAFVPANVRDHRAKTVVVGEDENVENINFNLVRGGVITGRVTDADGRPVIQQQVSIFRTEAFEQAQQGSQPRPIFASSGGQTDDRGIYRVFGLPPGRYKVGAGRSDNVFNQSFGGTPRSAYKQVFHPDVSDQAKATVIEVDEGTEATNVDIALGRALQTFTVAGRLVDGEKGLPVPSTRLGLQRDVGQRSEFVSTSATSNAKGDFIIEGLIPGKYSFYLFPTQHGGLRVETPTFDIIDQDLTGLTVKLIQGASVSGVVVLESENKSALAKFSDLQLQVYVMNANGVSGIGSSAQSVIAPDGSFRLAGLPGGFLNIMLAGTPTNPFASKGFNVARIERDGITARERTIEIKEGEQVTGIRIVLGYGTATLRGVVKFENGTLPEGAVIYVRLTIPGEKLSHLRMPQVDARGHFLIENLVPGVYEVHTSVSGLGIPQRMVKREVSVQDGVITDVTITIDLSIPPKP